MTLDQYLRSDGAPKAAEFGLLTGLSEASISRIRKGEQNITRDVMLAIIKASGGIVTAGDLVTPTKTSCEVEA